MDQAHDAIVEAFREESGRVVATLMAMYRDLDVAEDATQEAFVSALEAWERNGIPANAGAWLTTVAKHKALDRIRRSQTLARKYEVLAADEPETADPFEEVDDRSASSIDDDLLRLIFTCCHPSLAVEAQVPLTLRALCGLTTSEIARALLVPEPTLAQRLVRAKRKVRDAGIPFAVPPDRLLAERLEGVLTVVYLVFNEGYSASEGTEVVRADLSNEALRLSQTLARVLPGNGEVLGLLALMLLNDSRRAARQTAAGEPIVLEDQDRSLWDREKIEVGLRMLDRARSVEPLGAYGLQAAIAAEHAKSATPADTDWHAIVRHYDALLALVPSPVVELNRAVAVAMADGPEHGLALVEGLEATDKLKGYRWLHSARADLLRRSGRFGEAAEAYRRALSMSENTGERAYLSRRLAEAEQGAGATGRTP